MANRVRKNADGTVTARWSTVRGGSEQTWRFPSEEAVREFTVIERAFKSRGEPAPHPRSYFERAGQPQSSGAMAMPTQYTLGEWVGTTSPGPFFTYGACTPAVTEQYMRLVRNDLAHLADRPMPEIAARDAVQYLHTLLVCPACLLRADRDARDDILDSPETMARADLPAFDRNCRAPDGSSTHYPAHRRETIQKRISQARRLFAVAIEEGSTDTPEEPRCAGVTRNPFRRVRPSSLQFAQRPANVDFKRALTFAEVELLAERVPDWAEAAIWVCTYAMLRGGELLALRRGDLVWPASQDDRGQIVISLTHALDTNGDLRPWAKTPGSTGVDIWLPSEVSDILESHLREKRSTPDLERCSACARGEPEHRSRRTTNPHSGCDLADDTRIFVMDSTGEAPSVSYFSRWVIDRAVEEAGLASGQYRPTLHALRMTGATLRLEAGQPFEIVRAQGRWSLTSTMFNWYIRPSLEAILDSNERVNDRIRAGRGKDDGPDEDDKQEIARLRTLLDARNNEIARLRFELETGSPPSRGARGKPRSSRINAESLREALPLSSSIADACRRLRVAPTSRNYERIRRIAGENEIPLPLGRNQWSPR